MAFPFDFFKRSILLDMLSTKVEHCEEEMLFHSLCTASHSLSLFEKVLPANARDIMAQIFSIGFKSGIWPGQNITSIELSASHFLVTLVVCAGALSC